MTSGVEKIKLQLRTTPLEKEIAQGTYPKDTAKCLRIFERRSVSMAEEMYEQVKDFVNLSTRHGEFWKADGSASLVEWLAKRNMPCGATLARREILVRLFDKTTFVRAGDDSLGDMTFLVSKHQPDSELRRRDYEAICEAYNKRGLDYFDKTEFRKLVYWYINTTYIEREKRTNGNTARPPKPEPKGSTSKQHARPIDENEPDGLKDFVVELTPCGGCRERDKHVAVLELLITSELGAERLPPRPY